MSSDNRSIAFERIKNIALENVHLIRRNLIRLIWDVPDDGITRAYIDYTAGIVGSIKALKDGKIIRAAGVLRMLDCKIRDFIRGLDIRCLGELLELIPKGCDSRLPAWLYKGAIPCMYEDGWVLVPA